MRNENILTILALVISLGTTASAAMRPGWHEADIGRTVSSGGASFDEAAGTWTVRSSNKVIDDQSLSYRYVYTYLKGDGEIIVRIVDAAANDFDRAGVMICEGLSPSQFRAVRLEIDHFFNNYPYDYAMYFHPESEEGHYTVLSGPMKTQRYPWLWLKRSGDRFVGYISRDGKMWEQTVSDGQLDLAAGLSMGPDVYIGFYVPNTSDPSKTVQFDNVDVIGDSVTGSGNGWTVSGDNVFADVAGNAGIGTQNPAYKLDIRGTTATDVLVIRGGADLAEPFSVSGAAKAPPGVLMVIDDKNPGRLKLSCRPYDKRVAGVVSGAGGLNPGLTLTQKGIIDGGVKVALTGRVYALADTSNGPIKPGDMLTTSTIPGHAMKATDSDRSRGAVIGKAMSSLEKGRGLVLVLVSLQ